MTNCEKALEYIKDGDVVGLGSGQTAAGFIQLLGKAVRDGLRIRAVPTSQKSEQLARQLGIPLTATITPIELSVGYRRPVEDHETIIPYIGAGVGWYNYKETSSFSDTNENVDIRKNGYLANVGVELRLHRWVGVAVDAQYTHIADILGTDGISKDANEKDLGGIAARFKLIVGR